LTKAIYRRVPILIDESREHGGNRGHFLLVDVPSVLCLGRIRTAEKLAKDEYKLVGNRFVKRKHTYLPLYEAKMLQVYDHRAAGVEVNNKNWMRQGQTVETTPVEHQSRSLSCSHVGGSTKRR